MTATQSPEYKKLALDSSNDMMDHDGDRALGRYPKAAWHILQAGLARYQMGQMMFDAGEFAQAAADWLSAAACFHLATDLNRMRATFDRAQTLVHEGKVPPERRDIHAALKEREEQIKTLDRKLTQFRQDYDRRTGQEALDWLLGQVCELPGFPFLHAAVSNRALSLGQPTVAARALSWARQFDPRSPHLAALYASQLFAFGESVQAAQVARDVLKSHPEMGALRILLAQSLAFRAGGQSTEARVADWQAAIEVLHPLVTQESNNAIERFLALSLATILQHGIGHEAEYRRLLRAFDRLANASSSGNERDIVATLRRTLPQVFPQPGTNETHSPPETDYSAVRDLFDQFNALAAGAVA